MKLTSHAFLKELHLLFGGTKGRVDNGIPDGGWNCFAKAFVTMYLCRFRGMEVDVCDGKLLIGQKNVSSPHLTTIEPHAWVGSPQIGVIDLSIHDFEGRNFLPIFQDNAIDISDWVVGTTLKESEFLRISDEFCNLRKDSYMLYFLERNRLFEFEDLFSGSRAVNSPVTTKLLEKFNDDSLLAKGILHLYKFLEGKQNAIALVNRIEAWESLNKWDVDAFSELSLLLK